MMLALCVFGLNDWSDTQKWVCKSDGLEVITSLICNNNDLSESNPGGRCMTVVDVLDT